MASRSTLLALAISVSVVLLAVAGCSDDDDKSGAAGQAGAAGSSGQAGAAGATGGNAGAGGMIIGTGGSSGAAQEAGTDAETCAIANIDLGQECNACAKQHCCAELSACDGKPDCVTLIECVAACPVDPDAGAIDPACIQTCAAATPVMSEYNPAVFCLGGTDCGPVCPF